MNMGGRLASPSPNAKPARQRRRDLTGVARRGALTKTPPRLAPDSPRQYECLLT